VEEDSATVWHLDRATMRRRSGRSAATTCSTLVSSPEAADDEYISSVRIVYSVFGGGSRPGGSPNCVWGADGGPGVSCAIDLYFEAGTSGRIESRVIGITPEGERHWEGTFVNEQTGVSAFTGDFYTDASYGSLYGSCFQWLEWWPFNSDGLTPDQRACHPSFTVRFGAPTAFNPWTWEPERPVAHQLNPNILDDSCALAAGRPNIDVYFNDAEGAHYPRWCPQLVHATSLSLRLLLQADC
jgi:hypothetical protein